MVTIAIAAFNEILPLTWGIADTAIGIIFAAPKPITANPVYKINLLLNKRITAIPKTAVTALTAIILPVSNLFAK